MTEQEYTKLYTEEYGRLLNNVKKLLIKGVQRKDHESYIADADDCVQEAFMALWKKRDTLTGNPKEYLYKVSRNQALRLRELSQRYDQWGMPIDMERIAK